MHRFMRSDLQPEYDMHHTADDVCPIDPVRCDDTCGRDNLGSYDTFADDEPTDGLAPVRRHGLNAGRVRAVERGDWAAGRHAAPGPIRGCVMFNFEWRELVFLACVVAFWLVVLKRIFTDWNIRRHLHLLYVANPAPVVSRPR
jgi:hypothetical protein